MSQPPGEPVLMTGFLSRQERFDRVGSTNDVVNHWLGEGTAEVCLAVADEQTAGRGRAGRAWVAPPGAGLLLSLGFRPTWLDPDRAWRLAAIISLAMAAAAAEVAGLPDRAIRLKWPNDLVFEPDVAAGSAPSSREPSQGLVAVRKVAGLLGETQGLGTADPRVVVGLGINVEWPADDFPPELAGSMTSLREACGGRPIDAARLLEAFLARLEVRVEALRGGRFDDVDWTDRQLTTGRMIRLERPNGSEIVRALGVDVETGALVVENAGMPNGERQVLVGEIRHVRLVAPVPAAV